MRAASIPMAGGIDAGTLIWAAGVVASPAARWLGAEADRAGRVKVNADLSLPGHPEIFVIGDTATVTDAKGRRCRASRRRQSRWASTSPS